MDSLPSCDSSFRMLGSQVNVTNLDTSRAVKKHLYPVCDLQFEYRGEESGRVLCMVFQSLSHNNPGCRFNYTLKVFADVPETGQTLVSVSVCLFLPLCLSMSHLLSVAGTGIMEADDHQVTTVFTIQPSFHHRHSTNQEP